MPNKEYDQDPRRRSNARDLAYADAVNLRRFAVIMESDEYTRPMLVLTYGDLSRMLEGCEAAVLLLEVGQFTTEVPMSAVIRLKDVE